MERNIVTPVLAGDVLVISGTRKGTFGYRIEKTGDIFSARQVWHNADLPMYMSSPVADGSLLYGLSSRRKGQLFCLDASTGQVKWATEGRTAQHAAIVSAGAHLLVMTTEGDLIVAKRSPASFEEVRRYKVADGQVWAHPAIAARQIVVRDATSIAVWSVP
jgi:outer membrane protein assembly factor BamB